MALLPPDSPRRRDRGKEEAARKQRARFARDVGDEHGQAWAHQTPRPKRSKFTLIVGAIFIAFVVLGALPLVLRSGDSQLIRPNCTTPAVAGLPDEDRPGNRLRLAGRRPRRRARTCSRSTRPTVTDAVTGPRPAGQRPDAAAPLDAARLPLRAALAPAPDPGAHEVTLFRRDGTELGASGGDRPRGVLTGPTVRIAGLAADPSRVRGWPRSPLTPSRSVHARTHEEGEAPGPRRRRGGTSRPGPDDRRQCRRRPRVAHRRATRARPRLGQGRRHRQGRVPRTRPCANPPRAPSRCPSRSPRSRSAPPWPRTRCVPAALPAKAAQQSQTRPRSRRSRTR